LPKSFGLEDRAADLLQEEEKTNTILSKDSEENAAIAQIVFPTEKSSESLRRKHDQEAFSPTFFRNIDELRTLETKSPPSHSKKNTISSSGRANLSNDEAIFVSS
jgi:hypothetical protein